MKSVLLAEIKKFPTVILHRHVRPDPDAYGSQMGLAEIIRTAFPDKKVYSVGTEEKTLMFLGKLDEVSDEVYEDALVIVCDTANEERIDDKRYEKGAALMKIDHHPNDDPYGDFVWVDQTASSCSEMIASLVEAKEELQLNEKSARLLYAGIIGDTGRFKYPNTTANTLRLSAKLLEYPFDRSQIYENMYAESPTIIKLTGYILENFHLEKNGASTVYLSKETLNRFHVSSQEASRLVSVIENAKGLKAWIMFVEEEDSIRCRLRSKGPIVNDIAKEFGGGGHPLAAGATVYTQEEVRKMRAKLIQLCNKKQTNL